MLEFSKILIANRGEIACRIMRTAHSMGYTCAVIYSSEEQDAEFVAEADEAYNLGSGNLHNTYLNIPKIIDIALQNGIEAIHPGYGFLSESYQFAKACEDNNLIFIGPTSNNISLMSHKLEARKFVHSLGIPLLRSAQGNNLDEIIKESDQLTFPVIVKAASGGGGKGMRIVHRKEGLKVALEVARREALAYFGDPMVYIEEYLASPRHIEVQVLGDSYGEVVHLFERECTIQRRHQKIIEEAPSPTLSKSIRDNMLEAALKIARSMNYKSAGTIEFLLDENQQFYFLEMNTRIQVEHPVTEEVTGIDIVREQIRIASQWPLSYKQEEITCTGHAMECRIYAEDPFKEFLPSAGKMITYLEPVNHDVRIDSSVKGPAEVSSHFDPMIAKVITHQSDRESVRKALLKSLQQYIIHGIATNITYLIEVLNHPDFIQNRYSTSFCKDSEKMLHASHHKKMHEFSIELISAAFILFAFSFSLNEGLGTSVPVWQSFGYWRNLMVTEFNFLGTNHKVEYKKHTNDTFAIWLNNHDPIYIKGNVKDSRVNFTALGENHVAIISSIENQYYITINGITFTLLWNDIIKLIPNHELGVNGHSQQNEVLAPLTGKILKVNVKMEEMVNKGDVLMVVESMKMENHILAPREGRIAKIFVNIGDKVTGQDVLAVLT